MRNEGSLHSYIILLRFNTSQYVFILSDNIVVSICGTYFVFAMKFNISIFFVCLCLQLVKRLLFFYSDALYTFYNYYYFSNK